MTPLQPLPWQLPLWQPLAAAIAAGRLGHALLLAGPAGVGKRHFAQCLAAALWCRTPLAGGIPCGQCGDCRQVLSEAHSGYHLLRVEEGKRDIAIDAVRELTEKLTMTSHDGRAKVAIIEPADALNLSGINALLKTIEEPTARSHLLLIAARPQALPATLRSRCQRLRLAVPESTEALRWLRSQSEPTVGDDALNEALLAAQGAPLQAQQMLAGELLSQQAAWARGLLDLASGHGEPTALAATIGDANAVSFTHWLYGWLARLLRARTGTAAPVDEPLNELACRLPPPLLDRYIAEVQDALYRVQGPMTKMLLLESLLIGWSGLLARAGRTAQNA